MGILDISLSAGMRNSLLSLKGTAAKIDKTQERLSTGKKVNSALDNPTNYFASQAALNRAGDLGSRKDGIMEAIKNGEAASVGLKSIASLIESAKGIANSAHSASASDRTSMAKQFNVILEQIDLLAGDSGYRGTNLIKGDNLTVDFNENGSSNLTISGVDATSGALGISKTSQQQGNAIASGGNFSLALKNDGSVVAWGDNSFGETTVPAAAQSGVISVAASDGGFALALKNDGSVIGWGANLHGETTIPAAAQSDVVAIAAGGVHFSLALKTDGSVVAWGQNTNGPTTVPVSAQSGVVAIAAGAQHSLALKNDGSVVAWGYNADGQATVPVAAQSGVISIAAAGDYSLALKSDGSVVAWGYNGWGQTTVPATALSGVVAIAAGESHVLALKNDGSIVAWGDNSSGQATIPAQAQSGVIAISAGWQHSMALKSDGSVVSWGDNTSGQTTIPAAAQSGVMLPNPAWTTDAGITTSETQLETAMNTLRTNSAALSSTLSVIAVRQDFTQQMINTLQTGSDNLTLADMNEEGANMLMLQTQQNLGITSLSLASQASQSVMKLF